MDTLRELIDWLHACWIDDGRVMQSHDAGRFHDAAEQAAADLQRYRDDAHDRSFE